MVETPRIIRAFFLAVLFCLSWVPAMAGEVPKPGEPMPVLSIPAPATEAGQKALGLGNAPFSLEDLGDRAALIEVIGVYCAQCYKQLPEFNKLYKRLTRKKLASKVAMFAIAAGGTPMEVAHLSGAGKYRFPVCPDEGFSVHKALGEPLTPFTMLVDSGGTVVYTHLGIVKDTSELYKLIKKIVK